MKIQIGLCLIGIATVATAQEKLRVDLEGGYVYQTRNTCAIPANGDKFSYRDLMGRGPFKYARLTAIVNDDQNSGYRILVAPLTLRGTGQLKNTTVFHGVTFDPGVYTAGAYTFNSYRFTWWKKWRPIEGFAVRGGWTLKIRDANVSLQQGAKSASFYNLGPVPLYYLFAERQLSKDLGMEFEFDGLVAPQGGAIDVGLQLNYRLNPATHIKAKLRYLDGGTGQGSAYSFATFNYIAVGIEWRHSGRD